MEQSAATHNSGVGIVIVLVVLLVLLALFALPQQLPSLSDVRLRTHAVEQHSTDAIKARERLGRCGSGLRVQLCPPNQKHGLSVCFWCKEIGATVCPGMYVTIGGVEKTAFIRPCQEWEECR